MSKPWADNDTDTTEDEDDEIEYVSKSQLKRDSHALQELGRELTELASSKLAEIPLPKEMRQAVDEARRIQNKRAAFKRQIQYLGKLLRQLEDVEAIQNVLQQQENRSREALHAHHLAEQWRDKLLENEQALQQWLGQYPQTERQPLTTLLRHCRKEQASDGKKYFRQLYQFLKQEIEASKA